MTYSGHFQPYKNFRLLDQAVNHLIWLALVDHANCHFKVLVS